MLLRNLDASAGLCSGTRLIEVRHTSLPNPRSKNHDWLSREFSGTHNPNPSRHTGYTLAMHGVQPVHPCELTKPKYKSKRSIEVSRLQGTLQGRTWKILQSKTPPNARPCESPTDSQIVTCSSTHDSHNRTLVETWGIQVVMGRSRAESRLLFSWSNWTLTLHVFQGDVICTELIVQ